MAFLVLTREQVEIVIASKSGVELRDPNGTSLGYFEQVFSAEDIEAARAAMAAKRPGRTTQEVLDRLRRLEEN